eukprot:959518-Amphidinium_carterae.1
MKSNTAEMLRRGGTFCLEASRLPPEQHDGTPRVVVTCGCFWPALEIGLYARPYHGGVPACRCGVTTPSPGT